MTYLEKLKKAIHSTNSTLCVGLDPDLSQIPDAIKATFNEPAEQVAYFCKTVIDHTYESCAAYKPNVAFFEALGPKGFQVLAEVMRHIPQDRIIVADAKRGDISNTALHYKKAFFDELEADAITLSPLMGFETLDAFANDETKGIYALTLTSNPGSNDFLKQPFAGFDMMAQYIANGLFERSVTAETHLGMVIGATQTKEAASVLKYHEQGSLLIPGVGAQGGSIDELAELLASHEGIPLINSSRGIIYAGAKKSNWQQHVATAASDLKSALSIITVQHV